MAPDGLATGYRRLEATANVGGALLPIYAPAQQDAMGEYTAKVGDAVWAGTGDGALQARDAKASKVLFSEGGFNISDPTLFPVRKNGVERGSFGKGFVGRDAQGNPVESVLYRGTDNKLYKIDQRTVEQFKKDPILKSKLDGYIPQFSPTEIKELSREAVPFNDSRIGRESKVAGLQSEAKVAQAESDAINNQGFFAKVKTGLKSMFGGGEEGAPRSSFFGNTNSPDKPEEAPTGGSAEAIVDSGNKFFRTPYSPKSLQ
jgi:hypothetical protein